MIMLTKLMFGCSPFRKPIPQEKSVGWKGKFALFRKLATWEEGGLKSQKQFPKFCFAMKDFKEKKKGE